MSRPFRITLLTDFGTADGYVAALKGVIAALAPAAFLDDASHDIEPGDIHAAAWALSGYWRLYEPPVVHVVVVDPGVGGSRRAIAAGVDGRLLVGPDNGVFTRVLEAGEDVRVVSIDDAALLRADVSSTFHGRDVFAPVAARLASGLPLEHVGSVVPDPVLLRLPVLQRDRSHLHGEVIHVDRFGNLITNIPQSHVQTDARVIVCGRTCGLVRAYADAEPGQLVALVGSRGMLEVSVRDGSAAASLEAARGAAVIMQTVGPEG